MQAGLLADALFRVFDEDGSGELNFFEFMQVNLRSARKFKIQPLQIPIWKYKIQRLQILISNYKIQPETQSPAWSYKAQPGNAKFSLEWKIQPRNKKLNLETQNKAQKYKKSTLEIQHPGKQCEQPRHS